MCYERRDPEQARACFERDQRKDDYISRKALLEAYDKAHVGPPGGARKLIEDAPAADVAPVVHGHWNIRCETHHDTYTGETDENFYIECSECRRKVWDVDQMAAMNGEYRRLIADYPHCHCGARMDGE